jgi:RNA-directed DNA polymerase
MLDRAYQALVKLALEPEWEAVFEANSYGFRPGRGCHDAIEAIFTTICRLPKYVLDADIEKCFDRIDHEALLAKVNSIEPVMWLVRGWLKAGVIEAGNFFESETGTPQGGVISPLLANIAWHGLESHLKIFCPTATIVRYADDFVILCADARLLHRLQEEAETWLNQMGLRLKPSKTRTTHPGKSQRGRGWLRFSWLHCTSTTRREIPNSHLSRKIWFQNLHSTKIEGRTTSSREDEAGHSRR